MSKDIFETNEMLVTAFVGQKGNASVQIGMKSDYSFASLTEEQILELVTALMCRITRKKGYKATD